MRHRHGWLIYGAAAIGLCVPPALGRVSAATFTVDSTADAPDAVPGDGRCTTRSGDCTLRAAIEEANSLPGPDVIQLPAGTYVVSLEGSGEDHCATGDLDITSSISIVGAGAATTIVDANHRDRAFDILPDGAAVISGVTVQNGSADDGGGIRVTGGTLKLVESVVTGNQAADVGGGVENALGVVALVRSTVAGNVAHNAGGGVDNTGTADLRNVTVSGNTADGAGGGIFNLGTTTLSNTTVAENTLTGVENQGQLVFFNSLLADNAGPDCQGTLTSRGFNLIHDTTGCTFDGDTSGDLIDMEAKLAPLQDDGGPTPTHALLAGSAAIDAANPAPPGSGDPACEATDQRGVTRPQGPRCDIGAFEACAAAGSAGAAMVGTCAGSCGNGVVDPGEQCDDGPANGTPGDPCDATCHRAHPGTGAAATCGNGILEPGEQCDDGNTANGDGCSSSCQLESPLSCHPTPCDQGDCDATTRFANLNCILQTPMCGGESIPGGVIRHIAKTRNALTAAWRLRGDHRTRRFVAQASRLLRRTEAIRAHLLRRGKLSPGCASDLDDVLGRAEAECGDWLASF
ncbi:MAG TPA: choice-of-anchor Q domain-containing protein [Candidatus Binatia bacterium]|nr:choice-of-anchor Q domain-containing protein [Candidatus Binatia bacterium]